MGQKDFQSQWNIKSVNTRGEYFYFYCSNLTRNENGYSAACGRKMARMQLELTISKHFLTFVKF